MEGKQYDEAYVNTLKEELDAVKTTLKIITRLMPANLATGDQCIITWTWCKTFTSPEGNIGAIELYELVSQAIEQHYRIISVTVTERDEAGTASRAFITALQPKDGKLHL